MKKPTINTKVLKYGALSTVITVLFVAIIIALNIVVSAVAERVNFNVDLTGGDFTVSDEIQELIKTVDKPVTMTVLTEEATLASYSDSYDPRGSYHKQLLQVINTFPKLSSNISVEFMNLNKNPNYAAQIGQIYKGDLNAGDIVFRCGDRIRVLTQDDFFNFEMNQQTYSYTIVSSKAESALATAVFYVMDANPKTACMLSVEGTIDNSHVSALLETNGYDIITADPLTEDIPQEADVIVLVSPVNDLPETVIEKLNAYLDNGGLLGKNLIYFTDIYQSATPNINVFLSEWGIGIGDGVVLDSNTSNLERYGSSTFVVRNYIQQTDYNKYIQQMSLPVAMADTRPLSPLFETKDYRSVKTLLATAETGVIVTTDENDEYQYSEEAVVPTTLLANKYTWDDSNNQIFSNVLVFGTPNIIAFTASTAHNNSDFFTSVINTMTGKESRITAVAKALEPPTFTITAAQAVGMFYAFVLIIPALILVTGIVVWVRRRNK